MVLEGTLTKKPLIKKIPSLTDADEPVLVDSDAIVLANRLPAVILVFEYSISDLVIRFSPSANSL